MQSVVADEDHVLGGLSMIADSPHIPATVLLLQHQRPQHRHWAV